MKTFEEFMFSIPHNKVKLGYKYMPSAYEELVDAIEAEIELQGPEADLNCIDTSKITDMANLFNIFSHEYAKSFNGDISGWNVSNVTHMDYMFCNAKSFNQDISNWNVSKVKTMKGMFRYAKNFNGDISSWDVSKVEDMGRMFCYAESFNQYIGGWDVSNVKDMRYMFLCAKNFNQDISRWDISNVKYYSNMFNGCPIKKEYKPKFKKIID